MKLLELDPSWGAYRGKREVLILDCPKCRDHKIAVPFEQNPEIMRKFVWAKQGDDFESVSMTPSVFMNVTPEQCQAHFFITNGEIVMV